MFAKLKRLFEIPDNHFTAKEIFRWLWRVLQGNRLQAVLNATIGLLGVGLGLSSVWAMQRAIDIASGALDGSLYVAVGVMAALILGEFAVGISRVWVRNILGVKAQNRMQQRVLARLLRSEWRGREAMHSGDIINRLEQDVKTVVTFLTETLPSTLSTLAMFVGAFVYLFQMDTWLAVTTVAILPIFILVSRIYIAYMRRYNRRVRDTDSLIQSLLTETMQHRMLVKTMEADEQMLGRLDNTQQTLRQWVRKRTAFSVASNFFLNLGFSIGFLVAFLWGALRLYAGTLTFGGMTAFLQLVNRIQGPARDLAKLVPAFVSVFTAAERLMELEDIPEEQQGESCMLPAPCGIRFEQVTFNYGAPGQQPALRDFSVDFKPGTCTAVMGETGTGKTTLIRLLLALVKPQKGEISIYSSETSNTCPTSSTSQTSFSSLSPLHRCNFVYVPQGNTLLSGTLRENLQLGNPQASDEQMREALQMACADFVAELPDGLDTRFSEQGGGLSEGQAQRIAIARALLRPGSIMLLDEATSALDAETEKKVLEIILSDHRRTVIFVTHRTAVIDYCDQVITIGS
ncbi:ABC-type bacteriocin/lantibiotic exporter, contains an N-terminal double-glycine peptidase domain [Prevotella communis]|uniref:ABC-type bacteriocin/lantibiotic exporter, contains an N-terminal double-glycine peptidase domain n=1 Tax=Prevotella communis TaxID=2913614 RepID=A0A1H0F7Z5_9BACT|nr:ABC transporter ATP-binding protein [Prevotella communis]SDG19356.1 ABC-type bacteriocin/lantibiotic exporter, contains an N-terminal double-glycine peptidase domain [Prevotella communis]SDN90681.1 ABC-type bacteriocin/lantibiotic exporter, contains an N-terminal double-glycine peptidase domain [Prevotella communis]